jgi:hypothetical protein
MYTVFVLIYKRYRTILPPAVTHIMFVRQMNLIRIDFRTWHMYKAIDTCTIWKHMKVYYLHMQFVKGN